MQAAERVLRRVLRLPCRYCRRRTPQEQVGCWLELAKPPRPWAGFSVPYYGIGYHCYSCGRTSFGGTRSFKVPAGVLEPMSG